jgi:lipoate-protein ligase A
MAILAHAETEQRRIRDALQSGVTAPSVMCCHYAAPALVLGRGQRPTPELLERAGRERLPVVGRASGGGAVLAGPWMLSLTLLLPAAHALARASLPAGYRAVGEACRRALVRLGVAVQPMSDAAAPARCGVTDELRWACFAAVSHGELVAAGARKIVGVSQVRRRDGVAVCIGVLLGRPDWEALLRVWLGHEEPRLVRQLESRTASCDQLTPNGAVPSAEALAAGFEAELPTVALAA